MAEIDHTTIGVGSTIIENRKVAKKLQRGKRWRNFRARRATERAQRHHETAQKAQHNIDALT